jgi:hypothetical protein
VHLANSLLHWLGDWAIARLTASLA